MENRRVLLKEGLQSNGMTICANALQFDPNKQYRIYSFANVNLSIGHIEDLRRDDNGEISAVIVLDNELSEDDYELSTFSSDVKTESNDRVISMILRSITLVPIPAIAGI